MAASSWQAMEYRLSGLQLLMLASAKRSSLVIYELSHRPHDEFFSFHSEQLPVRFHPAHHFAVSTAS
jgi:hypothetical protein